MAILLGFVLLLVLLLGAALFFLALVFLAAGAGIQLFAGMVGATAVIALGTSISLVAGAAFTLGLIFVAIGLTAFLFPSIRAFLRGLIFLLRIAGNNLQGLFANIPLLLRTIATLQDGAGGVLVNTAGPFLTSAGNSLVTSANSVPNIPTIQPHSHPLWLQFDSSGNRTDGYVPNPLGIPNVDIVTSVSIGSAPIAPIVNALTSSGNAVKSAGTNTVSVGQGMQQSAQALRDIALAIEQVIQ